MIDTSQAFKYFAKLKENNIVNNKKVKAKDVFKLFNMFFIIKLLLYLIDESVTSS